MKEGEPVVVVPVETWERRRRLVQHVSLVRDQLGHVGGELDRLVATVDEQDPRDG